MGKVYIVGAGPGDIELLTLKAYKLIQSADAILYDRLVNQEILSSAKKNCELIYVGKEDGKHLIEQEDINRLLFYYSKKYNNVVRLKSGDPFVFGRGGEEIIFLHQQNIDFEVIPGISSAIGVPTHASIPLTLRNVASSFAVITGHEHMDKSQSSIDWSSLKGIDTLVFLMPVSNKKNIAKKLIEVGRNPEEPVAFIENGTTSKQKIFITSLMKTSISPPPVNTPTVMIVSKIIDTIKDIISLNL